MWHVIHVDLPGGMTWFLLYEKDNVPLHWKSRGKEFMSQKFFEIQNKIFNHRGFCSDGMSGWRPRRNTFILIFSHSHFLLHLNCRSSGGIWMMWHRGYLQLLPRGTSFGFKFLVLCQWLSLRSLERINSNFAVQISQVLIFNISGVCFGKVNFLQWIAQDSDFLLLLGRFVFHCLFKTQKRLGFPLFPIKVELGWTRN